MPRFTKGQKRPAGSGRKKGTPNKANAAFKAALEKETRRRKLDVLMRAQSDEELIALYVRVFVPRENKVEVDDKRSLSDILADSMRGERPPSMIVSGSQPDTSVTVPPVSASQPDKPATNGAAKPVSAAKRKLAAVRRLEGSDVTP